MDDFDSIFATRLQEANEFYDSITPKSVRANTDRYNIYWQALAGMLWSKQYFYYDLDQWLKEHGITPWMASKQKQQIRNSEWFHMYNDDVISMPDKWEYPWFAAWDLAFHMVPLSLVDPDFAKQQLELMLRDDYLHPNGQIPAYEWNFSDVNPPVHAWATWETYTRDRELNNGKGDIEFLKYAFSKLLINFTWWVNRKDEGGNNIFEGGFLGLDNIGVFDRSSPLPTGGYLEQADGTVWMVFFSQRMLQIAIVFAGILAPLESLGWWAGWYGDDLDTATGNSRSAAAQPTSRTINRYVVYLDGIAQSGDKYTPDIEDFFGCAATCAAQRCGIDTGFNDVFSAEQASRSRPPIGIFVENGR